MSPKADDGLRIRYRAFYETAGGQLEVKADIQAPSHGGLVFEAEARAVTDFTTARTSFCILHPIAGVAGAPLTLTRPDETMEPAQFPDAISAHQPFMNIRALGHEVAPGLKATVRMEGDIWEMEDQRNWSDASFKTYGRPRDIPWPYTIRQGRARGPARIALLRRARPRRLRPPPSAERRDQLGRGPDRQAAQTGSGPLAGGGGSWLGRGRSG